MKRKNILVVGGAGYIGAHMVRQLVNTGYHAIVLDDLSRGHAEMIPDGALVVGDFGDQQLLDAIFSKQKIDAVIHFAALSLVGESVERPLAYYDNNVAKTIKLLDRMRQNGVDKFIFSSTAAVYGEPRATPITEDHLCEPLSPYGASKLIVERVLRDCDSAFGLKSICLRYFNAAGADESGALGERHDPETHLIPLVLQIAAGMRGHINVFGDDYATEDGTCVRDYVHVSDLAGAHSLALEQLLAGGDSEVYNLGNNRGYSVLEVLKVAREVTGHTIPAVKADRRPGDPAVLIADSSKIRTRLGWRPRYEELEAIIGTAWRWHRNESGQGR